MIKKITEKYREGAGYHTFTWKKDMNLEKQYQENMMELSDPTYKQISFIKDIENILGIKFKGRNKREARDFIGENIEKYKEIKSKESQFIGI